MTKLEKVVEESSVGHRCRVYLRRVSSTRDEADFEWRESIKDLVTILLGKIEIDGEKVAEILRQEHYMPMGKDTELAQLIKTTKGIIKVKEG